MAQRSSESLPGSTLSGVSEHFKHLQQHHIWQKFHASKWGNKGGAKRASRVSSVSGGNQKRSVNSGDPVNDSGQELPADPPPPPQLVLESRFQGQPGRTLAPAQEEARTSFHASFHLILPQRLCNNRRATINTNNRTANVIMSFILALNLFI